MTIWLNAHLSPAIAVWITATFGDIHQRAIGGIFLFYWVLYRNCDTIIS